jgi:hypothetical protein
MTMKWTLVSKYIHRLKASQNYTTMTTMTLSGIEKM